MFNKCETLIVSTLLLLFFSFKASGQELNNTSFYLVEEFDNKVLSDADREFLDKKLLHYQRVKKDSVKLSILKTIVEGLKTPEIWNEYNNYMLAKADSLLYNSEQAYVLFIKAEALYNKAYYKRYIKDFEKSNQDFQVAAKACKKAAHFRLEAKSYYLIALNFKSLNNSESAIEYFNKSLELQEKLGLSEDVGNSYFSMGNFYINQGNHPSALKSFYNSLQTREKINDTAGIASCFNRMATIYKKQNEINTALEYYKKSLSLREQINDYNGQAIILNNIGVIYKDIKQYDQALPYYNKSLELKEQHSSKGSIAATLNNIGTVYLLKKEYNKALEYYQKVLDLIPNATNKWRVVCMFNMARVYVEQGEIVLAKKYGEDSYETAIKKGDIDLIKESSGVLKEVYKLEANWEKALEMTELHTRLKDSVINSETEKQAIRLKANYDLAQKEQEIKFLTKEKEYQQLKIDRNRIFNIVLFLGLALLSTISFFVYKMAQKNKQLNELLVEQNKQKQLLMDETHHRVKNNLQMVNTLLRLQSTEVKDEKIQAMFKETQNRVLSVANLHERLYKNDNAEEIKLKDYLEKLIEDISNNFSLHDNITIETKIEETVLETEKVIPLSIIINEVLTNSFKYAFPDKKQGKVYVNFSQEKKKNILVVGDDGIGFNTDEVNLGLGFKLLRLFTKQLNGSIQQLKGEGAAYKVTFPN